LEKINNIKLSIILICVLCLEIVYWVENLEQKNKRMIMSPDFNLKIWLFFFFDVKQNQRCWKSKCRAAFVFWKRWLKWNFFFEWYFTHMYVVVATGKINSLWDFTCHFVTLKDTTTLELKQVTNEISVDLLSNAEIEIN